MLYRVSKSNIGLIIPKNDRDGSIGRKLNLVVNLYYKLLTNSLLLINFEGY